MPFQGVQSAQTVAMRPLDKGMILDQSSQVLPDGAFLELRNFIGAKEGLKKRPGYEAFAGGFTCPYKPLDFVTLWAVDGSQESLLITDKTLWRVNPISMSEVKWVRYNTGTVEVSGLSLIGSGTAWESADILPGDLVRIGAYEGVIKTVVSGTSIELESSNIPDQVGASYEVLATFTPGLSSLPDWTIFENTLIIADGKRPLIAYDAATQTLDYWVDATAKYPSSTPFVAVCVTSFLDRVWCGFTADGPDAIQRQRLRWSSLADGRDFSIATNYLDLPYVNGALQRILPLGARLIAYFSDAVFKGTQTNYPLLPVRFDAMETGGIGLVGQKAITSYLGGHFWVGQDDMYLTTEEGVMRIGSPVVKETVKVCGAPENIYVATDPWNFNVVFGFPRTNSWIERTWRYDYRSKAWSYETAQATMLANPVVNTSLDWQDLTGTWQDLNTFFPTWDSMNMEDPRKLLHRAWDNKLWKQTPLGAIDDGTTVIEGQIITKDFDYGSPDALKSWVRFGLKIDSDSIFADPIQFTVEVSTNRGRVWKQVGTLTVPAGFDEGYVNFRAIGSTLRIRLTTSSNVESYLITEMTARVRASGSEHDVSTQS